MESIRDDHPERPIERTLGISRNGHAFEFVAVGIRPTFVERLETAGCRLSPDLFRQRVLLKD